MIAAAAPLLIALASVAVLATLAWLARASIARHWRTALPRLPLPMLALAASYGVFSFNALFVPAWVALVSAAAFELTYVALAAVSTPDRRRATVIAVSAVVVSVFYNTLAGLFHIRPALLVGRPLWADVLLAVLHGLPLAIVAYNVAALLLHATPVQPRGHAAQRRALGRKLITALRSTRAQAAQLAATAAQAGPHAAQAEQRAAQLYGELETARAGQERAAQRAAQAELHAAQLEGSLAQAGDIDVRALAQWAHALGADKREIARQLRRPEATVRGWVAKSAAAAD